MNSSISIKTILIKLPLKLIQGALIGLGSALPGISGGVLSVIFGVYKPVMELLADPLGKAKTLLPRLLPYFAGSLLGFMGAAGILSYFLEKYPAPSVCLFVGLIAGMLPSLWKEAGAKGRSHSSILTTTAAMIFVFVLLSLLNASSIAITPGFFWYVFCGFCLALSIIAPGMSFSTLLMPLGLYTPFVDGIGHLNASVLIPGGLGCILTIACLAKTVDSLLTKHYSLSFHAIFGIVTAATVMIIPFESFALSTRSCMVNVFCLSAGVFIAALLERAGLG
ncbi:MAG: DUF368 domain-containing protein [Lachnospiraceae bacterium]|nr:DUF368 domain-containing protein [Lachnospiraceae bacterium]